jgi:sterol desaturase/sphingolipid hydroxylase (fatty acid hydroxylase superfamily)
MGSTNGSSVSIVRHILSVMLQQKMLFALWATYLAVGAVSYWIEFAAENQTLSFRSFLNYCFPWSEWERVSVRVDVAIYLIGKLLNPAIHAVVFTCTGALAYYVGRYLDSFGSPATKAKGGILTVLVLSVLFLVVWDLAEYVSHFLEHKIPFLWEFHKVHHSAAVLTPLTQARSHPIERILGGTSVALFVGLTAGFVGHFYSFSVVELMSMAATASSVGYLLVLQSIHHTQFSVSFGPLERVFISPRMHQLHHSAKQEHWDKNMANKLSIWDWCFRTGFIPKKGERLQFGSGCADDDVALESVLSCYFLPFIKVYRRCRPSPSGANPVFGGTQPMETEEEG